MSQILNILTLTNPIHHRYKTPDNIKNPAPPPPHLPKYKKKNGMSNSL